MTTPHGSSGSGDGKVQPDDLVERLIRLADSDPEIPSGGAARVKEAVRPEWRAGVRARALRRRSLWAGGLAAAAILTLAVWLGRPGQREMTAPTVPPATVVVVVGDLEVTPPAGLPMRLSRSDSGRELVTGTWLATDSGGGTSLRLVGGQSLRLDSSTRACLVSDLGVELAQGGIYVASDGVGGGAVEVRTAHGVVRETGTQFEVRQSGPGLTVRVREGAVALQTGDRQLSVSDGMELAVAADGTYQVEPVAPSDPRWDWVQRIAPPFEIEGQTAAAFLVWVAKETGLRVVFSDRAARERADTTELHGTIKGLRPDQAAEVVLPGCGLSSRVSNGVLTVEGGGRGLGAPRGSKK
jgi:hypothetical protein